MGFEPLHFADGLKHCPADVLPNSVRSSVFVKAFHVWVCVVPSPTQDFVSRTPSGGPYVPGMQPDLMMSQQNPYARMGYGQQPIGIYAQNQPLPPGQLLTAHLL